MPAGRHDHPERDVLRLRALLPGAGRDLVPQLPDGQANPQRHTQRRSPERRVSTPPPPKPSHLQQNLGAPENRLFSLEKNVPVQQGIGSTCCTISATT